MDNYISILLGTVGGLVAVTNIVVEVLKKFTEPYFQTNFLALAVAEVLTLGTFLGWCSATGTDVRWYAFGAAVVVGFFVAYAAMFGFDKLKQALKK